MRISDWSSDVCSSDLLDVALAEVQTGPRFALFPGDWDGAWLRVFALGNVVDLGRRLLYATAGGGAEITQVVGDRLVIGGGYSLRYKDYHDSDRFPTADDRTGYEHTIGLNGRYALDPDWRSEAHTSELQTLMRKSVA